MRERVLVSEIITLTSLDGAARSACTDALVGRGLLPTLASAELWEAVEPPVPAAGARGSDCFSMDFRTAEIQGLRFSDFGAVVILASSDGTAADGHVWGCFLAIDFSRMPG